MKLKRELSLFEAVAYGVAAILGAGIFVLIGPAAGLAGNSLWLSFLIAAFIAVFTGLSYAELSAMYPRVAAEFVYVKKAYGSDFWAFILSWLLIFTTTVAIATVSLGFAGYFTEFLKIQKELLIPVAIFLVILLSLVNFLGIKESSTLNLIFVFAEVAGLVTVITLGLWLIPCSRVNYFEAPKGLEGILSATTIVFFAYLGFEEIVNIAEETKNPKKYIPLAIVLSILITTLIYILISISVLNLASWQELSSSSAPLALAVSKVLGDKAFFLLSISALFSTSNTVLVLLLVISRIIYGISREGRLPSFLAKIHPRTRTPYTTILLSCLLSMLFVFMGNVATVAKITSLGSLITFTAVNLALIHLRFMKPKIKRPFKAPLNIGKFPVTAFFGAVSCLALIGNFELELLLFALGILVSGAIAFLVQEAGKKRLTL